MTFAPILDLAEYINSSTLKTLRRRRLLLLKSIEGSIICTTECCQKLSLIDILEGTVSKGANPRHGVLALIPALVSSSKAKDALA
jgi:hypothetical protein